MVTSKARRCALWIVGAGWLVGCAGTTAPLVRPAPRDEPGAYRGVCSVLAIQEVERQAADDKDNLENSWVQLMVSYSFEPTDLQAPEPSDVTFFFQVTQERSGVVAEELKATEIACERLVPEESPGNPQYLLALPPVEGIEDVRQAPDTEQPPPATGDERLPDPETVLPPPAPAQDEP